MLGKIHQQIGVEVNKFFKMNRILISQTISMRKQQPIRFISNLIVQVQELMMLGAFFVSCSKRHLPISMQNDRHYSDSWLHLFSVISTMMRKG